MGPMKLGIRYSTEYQYERAVGFAPHDIRVFPRTGRFQRMRSFSFTTAPEAEVRFGQDVFDNTFASCSFPGRADRLHLQLSVDLDLEEKNPFHFLLDLSAANLPFVYGAEELPLLEPYRRRFCDGVLEIPQWNAPTREKPQPTVSALVELNRTLHETIGYERREEGNARAAAETLQLGRGACRDVAVVMAECLRDLGLAARLVSGFLRQVDETTRHAEGSMHAWTEVYLPGAGWVGLDATNGVFCNHNFIATAVGVTPADITPISGSYFHGEQTPARMKSRIELLDL